MRKTVRLSLVAVAASLALAGCSGAVSAPKGAGAASSKEVTISLGDQEGLGLFAPLAAALKSGAFKRYGLNVHVQLFSSGKVEDEAFASGRIDIWDGGELPALSILSKSNGIIIGDSNGGGKRISVVVPTDSSVRSVKDLVGKKIAMAASSLAVSAWDYLLAEQSPPLSPSQFQYSYVEPAGQAAVVADHDVSALVAWEPTPSTIVSEGLGKRLVFGVPQPLSNVFVAQGSFTHQHPNTIVKFLKAWKVAASIADTQACSTLRYAVLNYHLPANAWLSAYDTSVAYVGIWAADIANLNTQARSLQKIGVLPPSFNLRSHLNTTFLKQAFDKTYPLSGSPTQVYAYPRLGKCSA